MEKTSVLNGKKNKSSTGNRSRCDDYMRNGGYPEKPYRLAVSPRAIFQHYLISILLKDVAKRHKVRNTTDLLQPCNISVVNISAIRFQPMNLPENWDCQAWRRQKEILRLSNEPYLFFFLPRFNNKLKLMSKAPKKVYVVDNGFCAKHGFQSSVRTSDAC